MANLLWLQGGACSGNTMSFLNADEPSACDLVTDFGINVLKLASSPDGSIPAAGAGNGKIRLWEYPKLANTAQPEYWARQDFGGECDDLSFSPDGRTMVRTGGWINRSRRMAKAFEGTIKSALAWMQIAFIAILLRRLAYDGS